MLSSPNVERKRRTGRRLPCRSAENDDKRRCDRVRELIAMMMSHFLPRISVMHIVQKTQMTRR